MKKINALFLLKKSQLREITELFAKNKAKTWIIGIMILFLAVGFVFSKTESLFMIPPEYIEVQETDWNVQSESSVIQEEAEYDYCGMLMDLLQDTTHIWTKRQVYDLKNCMEGLTNTQVTILDHEQSIGSRGMAVREKCNVYIGFFYYIDNSNNQDVKLNLRSFYSAGSKNTSIFEEVVLNFPPISDPNLSIMANIEGVQIPVNDNSYSFLCNIIVPRNIAYHFYATYEDPDTYVNGSAQSSLSFRVKANTNDPLYIYRAPDETWTVTGAPFDPNLSMDCELSSQDLGKKVAASADVHILYANGDKKLRRPLIFTDGLDLGEDIIFDKDYSGQVIRRGSVGWDTFITGLFENAFDEDPLALSPRMISALLMSGYDVLFVDFHNGSTWIQANGECLIAILDRVNNEKIGDGQNIVVGPSMGGQIARWALATLENRNIDHCTSSYVSFDSPQKGANIPLSLQALAYHFSLFDPEDGAALWEGLNNPAPKQLLVAHLDNMNGGRAQCIRDSYVAEMEALGYPKQTSNAAIACASGVGIPVAGFFPSNLNLRLFDASVKDAGCNFMQIKLHADGGRSSRYFKSNNCISLEEYETIYFGKLPYPNTNIIPIPEKYSFLEITRNGNNYEVAHRIKSLNGPVYWEHDIKSFTSTTNLDGWDTAPGCFRTDLRFSVNRAVKSADSRVNILAGSQNITFMPIISLLDINTTDLYYPVSQHLNVGVNNDKTISPFDLVYYTTGANLEHVEITNGIIGFVVENILQSSVAPSELNSRYNYAHPSQTHVPSTTVNSVGVLVVNGGGGIGDGSIPILERMNNFILRTGGCGGGLIDVRQGGNLRLAELSGFKAELKVGRGHKLRIQSGGTLEINHGSALVIEPEAELILEEGAIIAINHNSRVELHGKISVHGHVKVQSQGPLVVHPTALMEGGGHLDILGQFGPIPGIEGRILEVKEESKSVIDQVQLSLTNGSVGLSSGASLQVQGAGMLSMDGVRMHPVFLLGLNLADYTDERAAIYCTDGGYLTIKNSLIQNFYQGLHLAPKQVKEDFIIEGTTIDNCLKGIYAEGIKDLYLKKVVIDKGSGTQMGQPVNPSWPVQAFGINLVGTNLIGENLRVMNFERGTGIYAPAQTAHVGNNIWLTKCSTIRSNQVGIYMEGGISDDGLYPDWGLLHLSGATIMENFEAGVQGKDILLLADAINNPDHRSNVFLPCNNSQGRAPDPTGCFMFDICYEARQIRYIYMRGNYWGPSSLASSIPIGIQQNRLTWSRNEFLCGDQIIQFYDPYIRDQRLMTACDSFEEEEPVFYFSPNNTDDVADIIDYVEPSICLSNTGDFSIRDQFYDSFEQWDKGDKTAAMLGWEALAFRTASEDDVCRYFSGYALVMTPARKSDFYRMPKEGIEVESYHEKESFAIYPNPVSTHLYLSGQGLIGTSYQIRDISGKMKMSGTFGGRDSNIDVSILQPGMYFMSILDRQETQRILETFKLVKQ